jgi:hypothetical protein
VISTTKTLAAAVAFAALPMTSFASTILVEGGATNLIELGEEYAFAEVVAGSAADSRTFELEAAESLALDAEFVTLEFTGEFQDLEISITTDSGTSFASLTEEFGAGTFFALNSIFNSVNGLSQTLNISWSGILDGEGDDSTASFNIQAVPSEVPVPAAGLLLLGALGGVAGLRRRKKA